MRRFLTPSSRQPAQDFRRLVHEFMGFCSEKMLFART